MSEPQPNQAASDATATVANHGLPQLPPKHQVVGLWPPLNAAEDETIRKSIKRGVMDPVRIWSDLEGRPLLVDGSERADVWASLVTDEGMDPEQVPLRVENIGPLSEDEMIDHVVFHLNKGRCQKGQRALVAELANRLLTSAGTPKAGAEARPEEDQADLLGKKAGVSREYIFQAKAVADYPDLVEKVRRGEMGLGVASKDARFRNGGRVKPEPKPFGIEEAMAGLFLPRERFEAALAALKLKKNVVLQGPPGVGKTYIARQVAYAFLRIKDPQRVELVQFHQSYSYEDFIQGLRPHPTEGVKLRMGVFHDFCSRARMDPHKDYVFIIDEINRGNLSRIFGELLMLIDADKRSIDFAVRLAYSDAVDQPFFVPRNVHVLALMNTADRSLAMVDYALRRRFKFIDLRPQFESPSFRQHLLDRGADAELVKCIVDRMKELNKKIADDSKNLGPGFVIGHSFFCPAPESGVKLDKEWYRSIVETEIAPLLREYWFDSPRNAVKLENDLLR